MATLVLKLDEEKIAREKTYDIEKLRIAIDEALEKMGIHKSAEGIYESDVGRAAGATALISEKDWVMENLKELKVKYKRGESVIVEDALQLRAEGRI